jgi:hypothetical protein
VDPGERPPVPHVPDPAREKRVPGIGRRAPGSAAAHAGAGPRVTPPSHGRSPAGPLRCLAAACGSRGGWRDLAGVCDWSGGSAGRALGAGSPRELSGATRPASGHPEARGAATPRGDRGPGGQECPPGGGHPPHPDGRGGCSGLLLWGPARTQSAPGVGRARGRPDAEAGERRAGW